MSSLQWLNRKGVHQGYGRHRLLAGRLRLSGYWTRQSDTQPRTLQRAVLLLLQAAAALVVVVVVVVVPRPLLPLLLQLTMDLAPALGSRCSRIRVVVWVSVSLPRHCRRHGIVLFAH